MEGAAGQQGVSPERFYGGLYKATMGADLTYKNFGLFVTVVAVYLVVVGCAIVGIFGDLTTPTLGWIVLGGGAANFVLELLMCRDIKKRRWEMLSITMVSTTFITLGIIGVYYLSGPTLGWLTLALPLAISPCWSSIFIKRQGAVQEEMNENRSIQQALQATNVALANGQMVNVGGILDIVPQQ